MLVIGGDGAAAQRNSDTLQTTTKCLSSTVLSDGSIENAKPMIFNCCVLLLEAA